MIGYVDSLGMMYYFTYIIFELYRLIYILEFVVNASIALSALIRSFTSVFISDKIYIVKFVQLQSKQVNSIYSELVSLSRDSFGAGEFRRVCEPPDFAQARTP